MIVKKKEFYRDNQTQILNWITHLSGASISDFLQ